METTSTRRWDIDWLRIGAVWLLIPFHAAMIFNPAPFYHVRDTDVSIIMTILAGFISLWHMPLLFLLAGWSARGSIGKRGGRVFLGERVGRLLIPLVLCSIVYGPPIKYAELRGGQDMNFHGLHVSADLRDSFASVIPEPLPVAKPFHESFREFLPTFFTRLDRFTWSHLWFLAYLFTFSVLYLPILGWMRARPPRRRPVPSWVVYLPIVPLALIQVYLRPHFPGVQNLVNDWANFAYYSTYLLLGFALACHPGFERAVHAEQRRAFGIGLGAMLMLLLAVLGVLESAPVTLALTAVAGWAFIVFLLGIASTRLGDVDGQRRYLAEGSMAIYVLHQPAVVAVGSLVIGLPLGIAPSYLLVVGGAGLLTFATYRYVVRRFPALRVMHGMKGRLEPTPDPVAQSLVLP